MSRGDFLLLALIGLSAFCALLLGAKLWRMLVVKGPHWVGGSPWYVDKRLASGDRAFFIGVFGVGFLMSVGMTALFVVAAFKTYL